MGGGRKKGSSSHLRSSLLLIFFHLLQQFVPTVFRGTSLWLNDETINRPPLIRYFIRAFLLTRDFSNFLTNPLGSEFEIKTIQSSTECIVVSLIISISHRNTFYPPYFLQKYILWSAICAEIYIVSSTLYKCTSYCLHYVQKYILFSLL